MSPVPTGPSRVRTLLAIVLTALVALVVPAGLAHADNFGSTRCAGNPRNCVSLGDNSYHTWFPSGVLGNQVPGMDVAVQQAMTGYDRTDLTVVKAQSATLDVLVSDYNYGANGVYGWVECKPGSRTSGSGTRVRCDQQVLRINGTYAATLSTSQKLSLACHEIGHTVGLRHTDGIAADQASCMNDQRWTTTLVGHDISHLNATY